MLLQKQRRVSSAFSGKELDRQYKQTEEKDKNADAVDPVHIPDPFVFWPVGIFFAQVEIFRYLFPDAHFFFWRNLS